MDEALYRCSNSDLILLDTNPPRFTGTELPICILTSSRAEGVWATFGNQSRLTWQPQYVVVYHLRPDAVEIWRCCIPRRNSRDVMEVFRNN